jgi:hypothetical protein
VNERTKACRGQRATALEDKVSVAKNGGALMVHEDEDRRERRHSRRGRRVEVSTSEWLSIHPKHVNRRTKRWSSAIGKIGHAKLVLIIYRIVIVNVPSPWMMFCFNVWSWQSV